MPSAPRCERCEKRLATVHLGDVCDGVRVTYRICSDCWSTLCDVCPRAHKTDEDAVVHWVIDRLKWERAEGKHPGARP
jgi:protein-arginine kinase activator protein McsA